MKNFEGFTQYPEEFSRSYREKGFWKDKTISQVLDERFIRYAENTILIADDGSRYTYQDFDTLVTRLALHLNVLGLKLYDRVVLQLPNDPQVLITYLAILKAGGIPIMALPPHQEAEIGYFAEFTSATALAIPDVFHKNDKQEMASNIMAEKSSALELVLVSGGKPRTGFFSLDALLADPIEKRENPSILPLPDPDMPAVFQLSGGTTGIPKLIPRTHNDYVYNFLCNAEVCELNQNTVLLSTIPLEHNFAIACPGFKGVISQGGCAVISGNTSPQKTFELIQHHNATHWIAVPAMIIGLLNHPERSKYELSSLEVILTGGSKLNPEMARRIRPELGCDVQQVLGMAEGPLFWVRLDDPEEVKLHTQGRPQSDGDEFKIVDPFGNEVPAGDVGELWCRGPHTIRGYYRAPEHNAKAFSEDGFYKSGDLVRLHPSGNVIVEGRIKDLINRGGEKISAEEVENHILAHPDVDNCACVAMPDQVLGERACAYIVLKPKSIMTLESLNEFLLNEQRIAKFKLPERLEIIEFLPLTNVGKVNKKTLRKMVSDKLSQEQQG